MDGLQNKFFLISLSLVWRNILIYYLEKIYQRMVVRPLLLK